MPTFRRILFLLGLATGLARAQTPGPSAPVGNLSVHLYGNSDTVVSLPLLRPALASMAISSLSGSILTCASAIPTIPAEGAYVLVMTGSLEGAVLPITATGTNTLTVSAGGYSLSLLGTVAVNGSAHADSIDLVPYWTLDTVFPAGQGINVSTSTTQHNTEILLYNDGVAGTGFSPSATYYYYAGGGSQTAGWYLSGSSVLAGTTRLIPSSYFVVRHNLAGDTHLYLCGNVQMSGYCVPLAVLAAQTTQDNLVSLPVPLGITLSGSQLHESGAFTASTSTLSLTDELLVFNNTQIAHQKAPNQTYYYYTGNSARPAGWYLVGGSSSNVNSFVLTPGSGYIIRKKGVPSPMITVWDAVPPYLQ